MVLKNCESRSAGEEGFEFVVIEWATAGLRLELGQMRVCVPVVADLARSRAEPFDAQVMPVIGGVREIPAEPAQPEVIPTDR